MIATSIHFAVDALNHMSKSLEVHKEFKPFRGGVEIVNCTSIALRNIYTSAQHLLMAVVELLASAIFIILAIHALFVMIKMLIELNN